MLCNRKLRLCFVVVWAWKVFIKIVIIISNLLHIVDHEYDDAAGVEDEDRDNVDERISLHLATLLSRQSRRIPAKRHTRTLQPNITLTI